MLRYMGSIIIIIIFYICLYLYIYLFFHQWRTRIATVVVKHLPSTLRVTRTRIFR